MEKAGPVIPILEPGASAAPRILADAKPLWAGAGRRAAIRIVDLMRDADLKGDILREGMGIDRASIHLVVSGALEARVGNHAVPLAPCDVLVLDHSADFAIATTEPVSRLAGVIVSRHQIGGALIGGQRGPVCFEASWPLARAFGASLAALLGAEAMAGADPSPLLAAEDIDHFGDMAAAAMRAMLTRSFAARRPATTGARSQLDRICSFIDQNLLSPELTPELIGGEFAMSRASLYRLFEPIGGISGYIRRQRIGWAEARFHEEGVSPAVVARLAKRLHFSGPRTFLNAYKNCEGALPDRRR